MGKIVIHPALTHHDMLCHTFGDGRRINLKGVEVIVKVPADGNKVAEEIKIPAATQKELRELYEAKHPALIEEDVPEKLFIPPTPNSGENK